MLKKLMGVDRWLPWLMIVSGAAILVWTLEPIKDFAQKYAPISTYHLSFISHYEPDESEVNVYTYLPESDYRQEVLNHFVHDQENSTITRDRSGQKIHWSPEAQTTLSRYDVQVALRPVSYQIDASLQIPSRYDLGSQSGNQTDTSLDAYLAETDVVQVSHPEIQALWQSIAPAQAFNAYDVLNAIYRFTYEGLEPTSFKGTTDALTAARLGVASCNGKSRLFVALARLNNIPARLVGGLILDGQEKRTSHQWVEAYVQGHWVPFGPTNGYFAALPDNYLKLYTGDQSLIRHTTNINFDYVFQIRTERIASAFVPGEDNPIASYLAELNLSSQVFSIVLLFPVCGLLITFLRNVVGVKTFGIFMPMLIAAALTFTGVAKGALGFSALLLMAMLVYMAAEKMRLLKTARLAIVISAVICAFVALVLTTDSGMRVEIGMVLLFPVVIISFMAERLAHSIEDQHPLDTLKEIGGTVLTIAGCYLIFQSMILSSLLLKHPECLLIVLGIQLYLGAWSGLRITELWRFGGLFEQPGDILGINARNREIIYKHNQKKMLSLAVDKLASKKALIKIGVPVPQTIAEFDHPADLANLEECLQEHQSFVLKPNQGSQGNGIVVLPKRAEGETLCWQGSKNSLWSIDLIRSHLSEIISGTFSQTGDSDTAYIEPLIVQHDRLQSIAPYGLSDIRIVVAKGKAISAMLRMPTEQSRGKANLHQGAIGVAVDIESGFTTRAQYKGRDIFLHPDSEANLLNVQIPFWQNIVQMAEHCYLAVSLPYLGVDICLDQELGPMVLEVNGRPGLEIQNVNQKGFKGDLLNHLEPNLAR